MRARTMMTLLLPMITLANPWFITGGVGIGQHRSSDNGSDTQTQSHWHLLSRVSSALYEGMDGQLSYDIAQGSYENDKLADDNLSIDFLAHLTFSKFRAGAGIGLGFNHRKDISEDQVLNQAFVPIYLDLRSTGTLSPWKLSVQSDYFIHPPQENSLHGFNPLTSRFKTGLHYYYKNFEFVTSYQVASFSADAGIHGLNTDRIEGQVFYHWSAY